MTCSSIRGTAAEPVAGRYAAGQLLIDTYETPGAESLLRLGRERHSVATPARRLLVTEAGAAVIFVVAAGLLAVLSPAPRALSVSALALAVVTYLIAARVQYPVGSSWTAPTQLAFVPMLFVLPTPWVPLIVAACSVADQMPAAFQRRLALTRLLARVGDSFYALGPALVLVLFDGQTFSWNRWPLLLLAFGAQIAFDAGAGLGRTWFAERIPPCVQLPMVWLYATDACLSCIGLLVAASAVVRPGLMLLALPLVGLLGMLARERRQRLEYSLALSTAYRDTTTLLAQSQGLTQELERRSEALRDTNEALAEKARLLSEQKRDIEVKNEEIELARRGLEEKATQLALSSKYKSEFLANMSHELRTPLNSMLILSRLLAENESGSLAEREVEFARTIHSAGDDLLALINDILDLSKVEAGRMELELTAVALSDVCQDAERAFRHIAEQKGLWFEDRDRPSAAVVDPVRRAAARPGAEEPAVERVQVHPRGRGDAVTPRRHGRDLVHGQRHRGRDPRGQARPDLRGVPAGGRDDLAQVRRDRTWPVDFSRARTPARRRAPGGVRAWRRHPLFTRSAVGSGSCRTGLDGAGSRRIRRARPRRRSTAVRCS